MPTSATPTDLSALDDLDLLDLQAGMAAGRWSAEQLTRHCLRRIQAVDRRGPRVNSIIELDSSALASARARDRERRAGTLRGPLHGIPVLLKDNIATGDAMATSAGSLALAGLRAARDAHLVTRLREAGAVVLGKTNLTEWANFRSTRSTSGWSSRGGFTRNPHVLGRNTGGSSAGSAAAVAAGLAPLAVGTETDGSISSPCNLCGIVGFKPTVGLVSRDGIIPIAASQDTAGPMTRHVRDAALLLQVLAGPDARDPVTSGAPAAPDFLSALRPDALQGARLGIARSAVPNQPFVQALFERTLDLLRAQGAVLVDGLQLPTKAGHGEAELQVLLHEFKVGVGAYLRTFQPDAPAQDLAGLIEWNRAHAEQAMPWFAQELFERAQACGGLRSAVYREAVATLRRQVREEGLDRLLRKHRLDAVIGPTGSVAWPIDPLLGDHFGGGGMSSPLAVAGYPHLTVPMGFVGALPVGLSFGGRAGDDARILALGYAFEQASRARRAPRFLPGTDAHPPA